MLNSHTDSIRYYEYDKWVALPVDHGAVQSLTLPLFALTVTNFTSSLSTSRTTRSEA